MYKQFPPSLSPVEYEPPDYNSSINHQPSVAIVSRANFIQVQGTKNQPIIQYQSPPPNPYEQDPQKDYHIQQSSNTQPIFLDSKTKCNNVASIRVSQIPLYRSQIIWAIANMIFFFPAFLWIPSLIYSLRSKDFFEEGNFSKSKKLAKTARSFNLGCTIFGKFFKK